MKLLLSGFIVFAWVTQIHAASFDCAKAETKAELAICANDELSDLDSQMMQSYKNALENFNDQNLLKSKQRSWLKNVRNNCSNSDCLANVYRKRIEELGRIQASATDEQISCRKELGKKKAAVYVRQCIQISPASHPPCNDLNPCSMIKDEIKRGCELGKSIQGGAVPRFCD